jgi:hypothetical protein
MNLFTKWLEKRNKKNETINSEGEDYWKKVHSSMERKRQEKKSFELKENEWFTNEQNRKRPRSPAQLGNIFKLKQLELKQWARAITQNPKDVYVTKIKIVEIEDTINTLFVMLKEEHGIEASDAVTIFNDYLSAACPNCLGGITGEMIQTISSAKKMSGFIGEDGIHKIIDGFCPNCSFYLYFVIWHGSIENNEITRTGPEILTQKPGDKEILIKTSDITHAFLALKNDDIDYSEVLSQNIDMFIKKAQPRLWNVQLPVKYVTFSVDESDGGLPNVVGVIEAIKSLRNTIKYSISINTGSVSLDGGISTIKIMYGFVYNDIENRVIISKDDGFIRE